jgi:hypothetical protein
MANNPSTQYEAFDCTMRELMKVPHSAIKAKLDAEKKTKAQKKARKKNSKSEE